MSSKLLHQGVANHIPVNPPCSRPTSNMCVLITTHFAAFNKIRYIKKKILVMYNIFSIVLRIIKFKVINYKHHISTLSLNGRKVREELQHGEQIGDAIWR